ncbi:MAG: semialdehyde dehydrogenase [Crocinitomicaceae bacterium]|nr:semialdehyde dehydrogenase [Crocinitomicaceae bacterium]
MKNFHAIVIGATGATGRELVKLLLNDPNFNQVSIFVRTVPKISHKKISIHKIDFAKLEEYKGLIKGDILFSALGTTKKEAGGKKEQYLVDYTYQYEFAKIASDNGVTNYSLVSSTGANSNSSFFYPKIKGELEQSVKKLNFKKIDIFQPPMLIRQPDLMRSGEKSGIKFLNAFNKVGLLKPQKPLKVEDLASKMILESSKVRKNRIATFTTKDLF